MKTCSICAKEYEDTLAACPQIDVHGSESDLALIGSVIRDRYELTRVLGRGAMGAVYKATQLDNGNEVAIKLLHTHLATNQDSIKRFQHEAQAASSLMHPHIVRLYDVGITSSGQPYIAMEYLEGTTLSQWMRSRRYLEPIDALPIIRQVCEALAEAHRHGVLHRDIKPANIMLLNRFGEDNFVMVLDFSIAKVIQRYSDLDTTPGLIFGSPLYMSPERFRGGGDFRSDIYSMGIIMFQMLAGRTPFKTGDLYTLMNEHISTIPSRIKDLRPDADVPDELEEVVARALAKDPKNRQQNVNQLLMEINECFQVAQAAKAKALEASMAPEVVVATVANAQSSGNGGIGIGGITGIAGGGTAGATPASVFEIQPGLTPTNSIPAYARAKPLDDPATIAANQAKHTPELIASGAWNKSLIARNSSSTSTAQQQTMDRSRPTIRGPEKKHVSKELLALTAVLLIGIGAIAFSLLPSEDPVWTPVQRKIEAGALNDAAVLLSARRETLKSEQKEAYGRYALALGNAFLKNGKYADARNWFEAVPDGTKSWVEAQKQATSLGVR